MAPSVPASRLGRIARVARARRERLALGVVLLAALAFYLVGAAHFAQQPLRIEEQEWPPMAKAIYDRGEPVIPAAESHRLRIGADLRPAQGDYVGAWHPPLYLYTLAATMPLVGSDASYLLRGVGIAGLLAACVLLFLIAREVAPTRWPLLGTAGTALLLLHPYAIQGSTFLDIDTTIYAPALLLAIWLAIRFVARPRVGAREVALLGGALALVAWVKLTTLGVLLPVLALWWVLSRRTLRSPVEIGAAIAAGAGVFLGTYALWSAATGIPFSYTFEFTFGGKSNRLGDTALVEQAFHWHVAWFMPALLLLAAAYAVDAVVSFARTRRARPMDLVWGFGVAVLIAYVALSPTDGYYQGKYAFPALPALVLAVTWLAVRSLPDRFPWLPLAAAAVVALVTAALMPDLLTDVRYLLAPEAERVAIVVGSALALVVAWRIVPGPASVLPLGAVIVCAALFAAQSVRSYNANTSPMYPVTDTADFQRLAREVNQLTGPGDIVMASKDTGFYVDDARVIEAQDAMARGDALAARWLRRVPDIRVVATNSFWAGYGPETTAAIERCFGDVRAYGAAVLRRRTGCD